MGTRIHKILGYGLSDLTYKKSKGTVIMTDPRVNWEDFSDKQSDAYLVTSLDFCDWLLQNREHFADLMRRENPLQTTDRWTDHLIAQIKNTKNKHPLQRLITWGGSEFDNPRILQCMPIGYPDWYRFDDIIDYMESGRVARNRVKKLDSSGIYPFDGTYLRFRDPPEKLFAKAQCAATGKVESDGMGGAVDEKGFLQLPASEYNMYIGKYDRRQKPRAKEPLLSHLKKDWRPRLPDCLVAGLLWYGSDVFPDLPAFLNDLRPQIYTYWS